jgi:hypothetical protein
MNAGKKWVAVNDAGQRIGESHPRAVLTDHDIDLMFALWEDGSWSYARIAVKFEISKSHAWDILNFRKRGQSATRWKRSPAA